MAWAPSVFKEGHSGEEELCVGLLDTKISFGWVPCLSHGVLRCRSPSSLAPMMVLNRQRPSSKTVLGAAGSHWGMQGTLLSSHAPIQWDYLHVQESPSRFYAPTFGGQSFVSSLCPQKQIGWVWQEAGRGHWWDGRSKLTKGIFHTMWCCAQ